MWAVAAVHSDHRGLVTVISRIGPRPTERLGPVRGESRGVVWMESMAEGMADDLVGKYPLVPGCGQSYQAVPTPSSFIQALHAPKIPGRCTLREVPFSSGGRQPRELGENRLRLACVPTPRTDNQVGGTAQRTEIRDATEQQQLAPQGSAIVGHRDHQRRDHARHRGTGERRDDRRFRAAAC